MSDAAAGQTNYQYDAFGLLKQVSDASDNVVSQVTYNLRGMRTQLVDVDLGTWSFSSNALGEVISQTDARIQTTTFTYDPLGRLTSRTEAEGTSTWTWGSSAGARNIGRLESVSGPGYGEIYTYDSRGRLATRSITSDASYQYDYAYNTLGQLHTLTWPTSTAGVRFKAKYGYAGGQLVSVQDYTGNVNGPQLWGVNLLDARGRPTSESYGNGLWVQNGFHALTGEAVTRKAGTGGAETNVQHLLYSWDTAGNLTSRQDLRQSLTESFSYDALDRLTSATGPGGTLTVAYDAIGNITSRSDVGSYTYHASKKHAVIAAGGNSYGYDNNGNLTTRNGSSITWTSANLPATLNAAGYSATFSYAPDRARWRQVSTYASGTETTIYVGGLLEKLTTPVRTHWKHRIPTPSGQVQVIRRSDGTSETLYLTTDHLGSTEAVLNASGTVLARTSFAAWGARRGSNWQGVPSQPEWQAIADTTRRGYTGHEHLDNVMLVHMNGRVYDPAVGRFVSADPFIDCTQSTQGWNRYSYVKNNPLAFTDPSGFSRIPPSAPILPIDPVTGLEQVIVTASRLRDDDWNSFMVGIVMNFAITTTSRPTGATGGGGQSGGDGAEQRGEKQKKCVEDCRNDYEGAMQTAAGVIGGAVGGGALALQTGNLPGVLPAMGIGALVGGVTGAASGYMTQAVRSGGGGGGVASVLGAAAAAPVGYTATAFAQGGSATFGGAMVGAASGVAGGVVPGSGGAAVSSGISALAATQASMGVRGLAGVFGAIASGFAYDLMSVVRDVHCESQCSAH